MSAADTSGRVPGAPLRVGYVMSRFPKLTETFVMNEIVAVERLGVQVDIYPLLREPAPVLQPGAAELVARARYLPLMSWPIVRSQIHFLRHAPGTYLRALAGALLGTFGSLRYFAGAVLFFPKIAHAARQMAADGVDHVHCHFASHPALAGHLIHRLTGIPYSFTAHGSDIHVDRRMLAEKVAAAAFAVPISRANAEVILGAAGPDAGAKLRVIHCGVDTSLFRPGPPRAPSETFTIAAVGTLHEVKGQRFLIEACRILCDADVDVRCELIGDGPDERSLRARAASLGVADRISFRGRLTRDEIIERLWAADVLAAPSVRTREGRREGIPVVLMEAMACGLPVVASRLSGIPELVEDAVTGLLVPAGDSRALAAALLRLRDDRPLRERLGRAGRARVEADFDLARSAALLVQEFRASVAAVAG